MVTQTRFPQGPMLDPATGWLSLEWFEWFQNPQFLSVTFGTALAPSSGGTGITSGTSGGILGFTGTTTIASSALLTANAIVLGGGAGFTPSTLGSLGTTTTVLHGNAAGAPTYGAVSLTADVSGTLAAASGGTGNALYAVGDILYASTTTALTRLADVATGNALISGGLNTAPAWGKIGIGTHVSGLATGIATWLGSGATADLRSAVVGTTGTVDLVFSTSPTLITPTLGVAAATSINFGQTALNYYGEGTWAPTDASGAGLALANVSGVYTRVGNLVTATCRADYPVTASGVAAVIGGLPFTSQNVDGARGGVVVYSNAANCIYIVVNQNSTSAVIFNAAGGNTTNAQMSGSANRFQFSYHV